MNLNSFQYTYSRHSRINIDRHVPSAASYHFEDLSKALDPGQGTLADWLAVGESFSISSHGKVTHSHTPAYYALPWAVNWPMIFCNTL